MHSCPYNFIQRYYKGTNAFRSFIYFNSFCSSFTDCASCLLSAHAHSTTSGCPEVLLRMRACADTTSGTVGSATCACENGTQIFLKQMQSLLANFKISQFPPITSRTMHFLSLLKIAPHHFPL